MKKIHVKSPCCGAGVVRYGSRRRQCLWCRSTWVIRPKRRGRRRRRIMGTLAFRYLAHECIPVTHRRGTLTGSARSARLRLERDELLRRRPWRTIPKGPLIAVADAIVRHTKTGWYTWFLILVRAIEETEAVILPPVCLRGAETCQRWRQAFSEIPPSVTGRIVALVSDGHLGLVTEAKWRGWHIQRCHFHLLARIQSRRSRWRIARHKAEAGLIFQHIRNVLKRHDESTLTNSLNILEEIGWTSTSPEIRKVLSGFVRNYQDYRTYLVHPELNLPTTNNAVESLNALIQALCQRARGFRTLSSLNEWITALCKARGTMKCRGNYQQN